MNKPGFNDNKYMGNNDYKHRVPYYQDQIFDNNNYERRKKMSYDPTSSITQDGQQTRGVNKKKFYIKPFTIYNFNEKQLFTLRPRNAIYEVQDEILRHKHVGYMVLKLTPMEEVFGNSQTSTHSNSTPQKESKRHAPDYDSSKTFVLTSKNIGAVLALKTTNDITKYEVREQVLESTTSRALKQDFLTLLKLEKKFKAEPTEDKIEFEITYFEAKNDELLNKTSITLTLGQMVMLQVICKRFLGDNVHGWNILNHRY